MKGCWSVFGKSLAREAKRQQKCNDSRRLSNQVLRLTKIWLKSFRCEKKNNWILEMPYQNSQEDLRTKTVGEGEVKLVSWNINLLDKEEDDVANNKE